MLQSPVQLALHGSGQRGAFFFVPGKKRVPHDGKKPDGFIMQRKLLQQSVELEQQKILSGFMRDAGKLIGGTAVWGGYLFTKGPFGQLAAFLQGTVTAVEDDLSAPLHSLVVRINLGNLYKLI